MGDQQLRRKYLLLEKLAHQPQRCPSVAPALNQHVADLAFMRGNRIRTIGPALAKDLLAIAEGDAGPTSGCPSAKPITIDGIATSDFTVVVRMGKQRQEDRFYFVPTIVTWGEISKKTNGAQAKRPKRHGHVALEL